MVFEVYNRLFARLQAAVGLVEFAFAHYGALTAYTGHDICYGVVVNPQGNRYVVACVLPR